VPIFRPTEQWDRRRGDRTNKLVRPRRASLAVNLAALLVTACGSTPKPQRVGATDPTVTHRYYGDPYGPQLELVTDKAFDYSQQRFGTSARLRNIDQRNDSYYTVFEYR